jgi:serine phosphatase RsbU (regulator of sigma subunit)
MAKLSLKMLLSASSGADATVAVLLAALEGPLSIEDCSGTVLMGTRAPRAAHVPVVYAGAALGCVSGPRASAEAVASMLTHMAAREAERRALAGEVLHLYREIHLIDQLSEDLTALLDVSAVCRSALAQARRLIAASSGGVLVGEKGDAAMRYAAVFGEEAALPEAGGRLATSILDRGVPEIVNVAEMFSAGPEAAAAAPAFRSVIFAPLRAKQRNLGLIVLANEAGTPYTAGDLKLLNTIALQTAAAIENSVLCAQMVDAARYREQLTAIEREMDTARAIQHSLLPRTFPPFPERTDFEIHAQMTSARAVGGDFFDFFLIDDDHLGLVIGDVSGKGTPAALYMAMTHTHVKTVALRGMAPEDCMGEVNRILRIDNASAMFATCFYGILNARTGELRYSNAGHNQPYRIGTDGAITPLDARGGTPLGLFPWKKYDGATAQLGPGDGLFLFTDGVPEAENPKQDEFTNDRLVEVLSSAASRPSREVVEMMHARLVDFTAGAPQSDDITMLSVRRTGLPRGHVAGTARIA